MALLSVAALGTTALPACDSQWQGVDPTPQNGAVEDTEGKEDGWGTASSTKILVLRGTIVTMDESLGDKQVITNGAVVIKGQKISQILTSGQALPTGANVVVLPSATGTSDWVITPGLINAHNHLAYNTSKIYPDLPLYQDTYQWRDEDYYDTWIQLSKRLLGTMSATATELGVKPGSNPYVSFDGLIGRYSEAKELASGTTSTQGSYFGTTVPSGYGKHLARNMDADGNFGRRRISQVALGVLVGTFDPRDVVAKFESNALDAWLVHAMEGTDQESSDEFDCLRAMGLVQKQLVIIHGIALTKAQLAEMGEAGSKLIASPLDNLLYYGHTADLPSAWQAHVNVSIGTDWSPAGSKNLLVELKILDLLNKQIWNNFFKDRDMIQMVTTNPADAIGWSAYVGRLKPGMYADVAVYKKGSSPYRSIIDATEKEVRLVLVGGDPLFGDTDVMKKLKPTDNELVDSGCGYSKAIDMTTTASGVDHGDVTLAMTEDALTDALAYDKDWLFAHSDDARTKKQTKAQYLSDLAKKYPFAMESAGLDPMFTCADAGFIDHIRTDANIRTAYNGVCLDLRTWYSGTRTANCGTMPAHPHVVTVAEHDGTVPQRPAAWCAQQDWTTTGALPKP